MYVRLFDVDIDPHLHQPIPVAPVQWPREMDTAIDPVPVVFITQHTLTVLHQPGIVKLATEISSFAHGLCASAGVEPKELQIDCDWTAGTKETYFRLLNEIRKQPWLKGKKLSCTIRMHQVKFIAGSGVPPVDRGLLMCYSMGNLKQPGMRNSILDVREAKEYLDNLKAYSLPLDIALPLYRWCVWFREEKFKGIMHDVTPDMVAGNKLFARKIGNVYACTADTIWKGYELHARDEIRTEEVSIDELMAISTYTSQQLNQKDINVLLFSCDSITLSKYSVDDLEKVFTVYQ